MVFSNLLSMNILAKSNLALKGKSLCFTTSASAHFAPMVAFVMNGLTWEAHTRALSSAFSFQRAKISL